MREELTLPDPRLPKGAHPRAECLYPAGCDGCSIETPADACAELAGLAGWTTPADPADPFVVDVCWMNATANGRHIAAHMADEHLAGPPAPWAADRLERLRILAGGHQAPPTDAELERFVAEISCSVCGCTESSACDGGCAWRTGLPDGVRVCTSCEVPA